MKYRIAGLICAALLTGCVAPTLKTASGRPEVTVAGVPFDQVRTGFISHMMNRGFVPKTMDQLNCVFEKEATGLGSVLFASRYDPTAWARCRITFLQLGTNQVRVMFSQHMVTNRGSAFENETEVQGGQDKLQSRLELMKSNLEAGRPIDDGLGVLEQEEKKAAEERRKEASKNMQGPKRP